MKYYVDPDGNRYKVDRETGEKVLIQSAESKTGNVSTPDQTTDTQED